MLDKSKEDYLINWYVELDLMCEDLDSINMKGSLYFIGYGVGVVFFFLHQAIGRKGSMKYMLPFYILACYLSVYS